MASLEADYHRIGPVTRAKSRSNQTPDVSSAFNILQQPEELPPDLTAAEAAATINDERIASIGESSKEILQSQGRSLKELNGVSNKAEVKQKGDDKAKKPNQTVEEAAAKITATGFASFLAERSEGEMPMMRFAQYFERVFSAVSLAQFSWVHLFRNHTAVRLTQIPVSHISKYAYTESINWIRQQAIEELCSFIQWCLERLFAYLESRQYEDISAKSPVDIFMALALVLRQRPCVLVLVQPILKRTPNYQGQDMLNVIAWMTIQASQEDVAVGLFSWANILLPHWNGNSSNPLLRDNIIQIGGWMLYPKEVLSAFESGTTRIGGRLIPPSAIDMIIRLAYTKSSDEDTLTASRFRDIYPYLIKVAFAGSEPLVEEAKEMMSFAIRAAGETNNKMLSSEAASLCARCLFRGDGAESYEVWNRVYEENIQASVCILKQISDSLMWSDDRVKLAPRDALRETIESFRQKNKAAIAKGGEVALFQEADKYCEVILARLSGSRWSNETVAFFSLLAAVVALIAFCGMSLMRMPN